jgi:hypothetical protein
MAYENKIRITNIRTSDSESKFEPVAPSEMAATVKSFQFLPVSLEKSPKSSGQVVPLHFV